MVTLTLRKANMKSTEEEKNLKKENYIQIDFKALSRK